MWPALRKVFGGSKRTGHRRLSGLAGRRCVSRAAPEIRQSVGWKASDRHPDATGEATPFVEGKPDPSRMRAPYCRTPTG